MRVCKECEKELTPENHNDKYGKWCNSCRSEYNRKVTEKRKDKRAVKNGVIQDHFILNSF